MISSLSGLYAFNSCYFFVNLKLVGESESAYFLFLMESARCRTKTISHYVHAGLFTINDPKDSS